ncbi:hypothetical protein [Mycolicibacterium bacteremicum]|nr:hypothetical protein [Mycolicibacterium bacteremicum]
MLKVATVPAHGRVRDVSQPGGLDSVVQLGDTYADGVAGVHPRGHRAVQA